MMERKRVIVLILTVNALQKLACMTFGCSDHRTGSKREM
jgi:hypothetical protein